MSSDAQLSANRANAELSTGPRTPEGKAVSSANARVHGIYSKYVEFANEEERDHYDELLTSFIEAWRPANGAEHYCVSAMARAALWKLRLQRAEDKAWVSGDEDPNISRRYRFVRTDYNQAVSELKHLQRERRRQAEETAKQQKEAERLALKASQESADPVQSTTATHSEPLAQPENGFVSAETGSAPSDTPKTEPEGR